MYVARWQFTARFGHKEECLRVLRKWNVDVAQRVGWRSLRATSGSIGGPDAQIELEVQLDNIEDLEAAWRDMAAVPYHAEYQRQLAELIVSGSDRWTIHRLVDLSPSES